MKKRVKYLLSFILLLAVLSPLSALAKGGEAEFTVSDKNKATLSLAVEEAIADDMTSLRLQLFVAVEGNMALPSVGAEAGLKFEFSKKIESEVQDWEVQKKGNDYIIDIIISGTKSIFANGEQQTEEGYEHQTVKRKVEIGTLTLSALGENDQFSAAVSLLPEQEPEKESGTKEQGPEDAIDAGDAGSNKETFDTTPILEYVEDNGIQAEELRMLNANTVVLPPPEETDDEMDPSGGSPGKGDEDQDNEDSDDPTTPSGPSTGGPGEGEGGSDDKTDPSGEGSGTGGEGQGTGGLDPAPGTEASGGNAKPEETETPPAVKPPVVIPPEESETQSEMPSETMPPEETETQSETTSQEGTEKQTETTSPEETEEQTEATTPGETALFDPTASPELTLSRPLFGSGYVHFSWTAIEKAVGYEVRQVLNGKNVLLATVNADDGTEYEQEFEYNTRVKFKVRAYGLDENGKKVYGKYGAAKTIKTPPKRLEQVTGVTATAEKGKSKVTISWENVKGADGIRIYELNKDTGEFKTIRTIEGSYVSSYTVTRKLAETYTFRVSAYKANKKGVPTFFGNYSEDAVVTTTPGKPSTVTLKSNKTGQVSITWNKIARAEGYQIYRSTSKNGKYTRIKTRVASFRTYTDTTAKSGTTYYYKIRAYVTGHNGKRVYGVCSVPKAVKVQ